MSLYHEILEIDETNAQALLALAVYAQSDKDYSAARSFLARVPRSDVKSMAKALYVEGTIALEQFRAVAARDLFRKSIQSNPDFLPAQQEYVRLLAMQFQREEMLKHFGAVSGRRQLDVSEAAMLLLAGRPIIPPEMAIATLMQFWTQDPDDHNSAMALVKYHLIEGDEASAGKIVVSMTRRHGSERCWQLLSLLLGVDDDVATATAASKTFQVIPDDLKHVSGEELWPFLWPQIAEKCSSDVILSIAQWRCSIDPLSTAACNALAGAQRRAGLQQEAAAAETRSRHLDQIELLAYRLLRPQARNALMASPVAMEIADHLQNIGQDQLAIDWLQITMTLKQQANLDSTDVDERLRQLQGLRAQSALPFKPVQPSFESITLTKESMTQRSTDHEWNFIDAADHFQLTFSYHNGATPFKRIIETIGGGPTVLDLDQDLWPDVFFAQGQRVPDGAGGLSGLSGRDKMAATSDATQAVLNDQVFRNQRGKGLSDVTTVSGIVDLQHSLAATSGDIDNDGFPDIVIANAGISRILFNNGDGTFRDSTPSAFARKVGCASCACLVDLDLDSNLDLVLVHYVSDWEKRCVNRDGAFATCDPREFEPAPNCVFRNTGDGDFSDVTASAGVAQVVGRGLGIVASDLTGDRHTDVFIANDGMPNLLLRNDSSPGNIRFEEVATVCGVAVPESGRSHAGMGVLVEDLDENGHADIFVTNFYREQNTLYSGVAQDTFVDRSRHSGLGPPSLSLLGFGTQSIDTDADGDRDIFVMNGDIDNYLSSGRPWKMPASAFMNIGNGMFDDVSTECGDTIKQPQIGRGVARIDIDGDGRDDLVAVRHDGPARIYLNQTPPQSELITLQIVDHIGNRDSVGVLFRTAGQSGRGFEITSGDGFASKNESVFKLRRDLLAENDWSLEWPEEQIGVSAGKLLGPRLKLVRRSLGKISAWNVSQ